MLLRFTVATVLSKLMLAVTFSTAKLSVTFAVMVSISLWLITVVFKGAVMLTPGGVTSPDELLTVWFVNPVTLKIKMPPTKLTFTHSGSRQTSKVPSFS